MDCPTRQVLLLVALREDGPNSEAVNRHVIECASCQREFERLWKVINSVRSLASVAVAGSNECLDDDAIADLVDAVDAETRGAWLAHLATCARCRMRLASVTSMVRDPSISAEVRKLSQRMEDRPSRLVPAAVLAGLAAAALAALMLWQDGAWLSLGGPVAERGTLRDGTITATLAPILSPAGLVDMDDSMRWTSVPRADLYRVTVWNRAGTVLWQGATRDTALGFASLGTASGVPFLWKVDARTGWDRWVSSDMGEFTIRAGSGVRR